jgi:hypothetical protein
MPLGEGPVEAAVWSSGTAAIEGSSPQSAIDMLALRSPVIGPALQVGETFVPAMWLSSWPSGTTRPISSLPTWPPMTTRHSRESVGCWPCGRWLSSLAGADHHGGGSDRSRWIRWGRRFARSVAAPQADWLQCSQDVTTPIQGGEPDEIRTSQYLAPSIVRSGLTLSFPHNCCARAGS